MSSGGRSRHLAQVGLSTCVVEDAADATVAAVVRGRRGIYNIVDDDPTAVGDWLPAVARSLGARPPHRLSRWMGRLLAGEPAVMMMTEVAVLRTARPSGIWTGDRPMRLGGII